MRHISVLSERMAAKRKSVDPAMVVTFSVIFCTKACGWAFKKWELPVKVRRVGRRVSANSVKDSTKVRSMVLVFRV